MARSAFCLVAKNTIKTPKHDETDLCVVTARNQGAQASRRNSFNHSANWPKGTKFRSQPELLFYYITLRLPCHHVTRAVTLPPPQDAHVPERGNVYIVNHNFTGFTEWCSHYQPRPSVT